MIHSTRLAALVSTMALIAPVAVLTAAPAQAVEVERGGPCGSGTYDFSIDSDDGRFEVELSLDRVGAFSNWKVVLRQNGERFHKKTVRVDEDGDRDIVQFRGNNPGPDTFKFQAKKADGTATCKARIKIP